jgi:hypothetical protein
MNEEEQFYLQVYKGNAAAANLALLVLKTFGVWAELAEAKPVNVSDVNAMMWNALVEMQANPIYARHITSLQPVIQLAIMNLQSAARMEAQPGVSREVAHVLRHGVADILVYIAGLVGDLNWARTVGPTIRMRLHKEDYAAYSARMDEKHKPKESA